MDVATKDLDSEIIAFMEKSAVNDLGEAAFNKLALRIFAYQYERNVPYRKFCDREGRHPSNVDCWKEIPAIPSSAFKKYRLAAFSRKNTVKYFRTSGTSTGHSGHHFFDTMTLYENAIPGPFKEYVLPDKARLSYFFLMMLPSEAPFSSLSYMMGVVNRVLANKKGKFYIQKGVLQAEHLLDELIHEIKAVILLATAFSLKHFLDYLRLRKASLKLPKGSRIMETGGFKGKAKEVSKERLYGDCKKYLGIDKTHCVSEYGMTELSSQFYDITLKHKDRTGPTQRIQMGPAWTRTIVIDPVTGQEVKKGRLGILRHLDLANRGSVIAVETEDIGRAVGSGFVLLGRLKRAQKRGCSISYEEIQC